MNTFTEWTWPKIIRVNETLVQISAIMSIILGHQTLGQSINIEINQGVSECLQAGMVHPRALGSCSMQGDLHPMLSADIIANGKTCWKDSRVAPLPHSMVLYLLHQSTFYCRTNIFKLCWSKPLNMRDLSRLMDFLASPRRMCCSDDNPTLYPLNALQMRCLYLRISTFEFGQPGAGPERWSFWYDNHSYGSYSGLFGSWPWISAVRCLRAEDGDHFWTPKKSYDSMGFSKH